MRVALIVGRGAVDLHEEEVPEPAPGGVVVAVAGCGICGTDVEAFASGRPYNPAVCGHEWTGTVSAVGRGVERLTEGERVVIAVPPACGTCAPCRAGHADACEVVHLVATGRDPKAPAHGGFAEHIAVDAGRLVPVDPRLDDVQATLVEPATIVVHAVRRTPPRVGDLAVVLGAGPIGLLAVQIVRAGGAGPVVAVEPDSRRRALAASLGADVAVRPTDAASAVADLTGGLGADLVYECAGRPESIQAAVDLARRGGSVCVLGLAHGEAAISPRAWLVKEITVRAALAYTHEEFAPAMAMLADGRIDAASMHTGTVGLDGLEGALADLAGGDSAHVKVIVDPAR